MPPATFALTLLHSILPVFSLLQAKGSLSTPVVVILVDVENLLIRA